MNIINVFGSPVTEGNRLERAVKAKHDPYAGNKRELARDYVRQQKSDFGSGIVTHCIFYNATGETLFYNDKRHSFSGDFYGSLPPMEVQNGQWGAFLHVKSIPLLPGNSMGYVIYRVKGIHDEGFCSSLIGWDTPWNHEKTHAFCHVYDDGIFANPNEIQGKIEASDTRSESSLKGIKVITTIENNLSPLFEALFLLEG
ncbi:hypothetical protein Tco_0562291 [Tanacetum coccineum]